MVHLWGHRAEIIDDELIITGKQSFVAIFLALLMLLIILLPLVLLVELISGNSNASGGVVILALLFLWTLAGIGLYLALYKIPTSSKLIFNANDGNIVTSTKYLKAVTTKTLKIEKPFTYEIKWFQSIQSIDTLFVAIFDSKNQKINIVDSQKITQAYWGSKVLLKTIEQYYAAHKIKKAFN